MLGEHKWVILRKRRGISARETGSAALTGIEITKKQTKDAIGRDMKPIMNLGLVLIYIPR